MSSDIREKAIEYLEKGRMAGFDVESLDKIGYFTAPASSRHHLAFKGGLIVHSMNVVDRMLELKAFENEESCYRVGMLHDVVKCMCYKPVIRSVSPVEVAYEYVQPPYPGHGVASVMILMDSGIVLYPEEAAAITWHMGAFGLGERDLKEYGAATRRFPREIILTHAADHLASKLEEIRESK